MIRLLAILFITFFLFSCEKEEETHTIKYTVEYLLKYQYAPPTYVDSDKKPCYKEDEELHPFSDEDYWELEYHELIKGDDVEFSVRVFFPGFLYIISVYIDGELVSSKEIYHNDYGYRIVDEYGLDDDDTDIAITFKY